MVQPATTFCRLQNVLLETAKVAMQPLPPALLAPAGGAAWLARVTGEKMDILLRHTAKDEEINDCAERASGKTRPFVGYGKLRCVGLLEQQRCYGRVHEDFSVEWMTDRAQ